MLHIHRPSTLAHIASDAANEVAQLDADGQADTRQRSQAAYYFLAALATLDSLIGPDLYDALTAAEEQIPGHSLTAAELTAHAAATLAEAYADKARRDAEEAEERTAEIEMMISHGSQEDAEEMTAQAQTAAADLVMILSCSEDAARHATDARNHCNAAENYHIASAAAAADVQAEPDPGLRQYYADQEINTRAQVTTAQAAARSAYADQERAAAAYNDAHTATHKLIDRAAAALDELRESIGDR